MEDKIFEMVIESMKQKLIFSDMLEMRKIINGAVKMMEAHYEDKIPSDEKIDKTFPLEKKMTIKQIILNGARREGAKWLKSQLTDKLQEDVNINYSREDGK